MRSYVLRCVLCVLMICAAVVLVRCGSDEEEEDYIELPIHAPDIPALPPGFFPETDSPIAQNRDFDGFPFPMRFEAPGLNQNTVTESDLGERQFFFIYLWATWCIACVDGIPGLVGLYADYGSRVGFLTLLADFDNGQETARSIFANAGASILTVNAMDESLSDLLDMLDMGFVPAVLLMNPDGEVINRFVGADVDLLREEIHAALAG